MNKIRRTTTAPVYEVQQPALDFIKSPLKRAPCHPNTARSPLRSRTPTRHVSPIKTNPQQQPSIRFISNVSPMKERERYGEVENQGEFSNGKSMKYINHPINDKFYQSSKKDRNQDFNRKSDRNLPDENRLFGKLVDKLNSEKKNGLKSNEHSYRTSVFQEVSDTKSNRMEQTLTREQTFTRNEGPLSKSPYSKGNREVRTDAKNYEKGREPAVEEESLSCLVYKVKLASQRQEEMVKSKQKESNKFVEKNATANVPSILLKRKTSKHEEQNAKERQLASKCQLQCKQEQDFGELNIFLKKIEQGCKAKPKPSAEDLVKMSIKLQQSLSMDPFL